MTTKSEATREVLVETALRLFRERGYEKTTMRLIATEAGVSQGNAYYYFDGKDAFVQELYRRIQVEHRRLAEPRLREGAPLAQNLRVLWEAGIEVNAPYHDFGSTMLHVALRPGAGVSPFSAESASPRDEAIALVRHVLAISSEVPRGRLGEQLPVLLWTAYLGVVLHWAVDDSPGLQRTQTLVAGAPPIVGKLLSFARLPFARGVTGDLTDLIARLSKEQK